MGGALVRSLAKLNRFLRSPTAGPLKGTATEGQTLLAPISIFFDEEPNRFVASSFPTHPLPDVRLSLTRLIDPDVVSHYNSGAKRRTCPLGAFAFGRATELQPTNG